MAFIKTLLKFIGRILELAIVLYVLFFAFLVIPNDWRIKSPHYQLLPLNERRFIAANLIDLSPQAQISHEHYDEQYRELKKFPLINDNRDFHITKENMHLSLGWYPLKLVHKNCLYVPAPTSITYELTLPRSKPALLVSAGILKQPVEFRVTVIPASGKETILLTRFIEPLPHYRYSYENSAYRNFFQYWNVQMEDRDYRWHDMEVDLSQFSGQKVRLRLETRGPGGQAFWGNPLITAATDKTTDEPKFNLILIVMDSTRRDAIGPQPDGRSYTPNLDKLIDQGVSFDKHLANGNMTKQSVTSFLTSRLPYELGDVSLEYVASAQSREQFYRHKFATLAGQLNRNGYVTGAIGVISLMVDGAGFGTDFGFNDACIMERYGYSNVYITNEAIGWLQQYGKLPFGLMVYYDSAHGPYKPPFRYFWQTKSLLDDLDTRAWYKTLYEAEVAYNDDYLGKLFKALSDLGLKDNTLVAVTSDHAENLDWHTLPNSRKKVIFHDHGISVKDIDVQVPLLLEFPAKISTPQHINTTTEHLDLAPTILDLLNLPPCSEFKGQSLVKQITGEKPIAGRDIFIRGRFNKGIRVADQYKYIRNFGVYEKRGRNMQDFIPEELYDLTSDPQEQVNIIDRNFSLRQKMRLLLDSYEPDPEINIFKFRNMGNDAVTGIIEADGFISDVQLEGKGQAEAKGNILQVNAVGDRAVVRFTTSPYNAALKIRLNYRGAPIASDRLLVSSYALPLLEGRTGAIGGADLYLLKGLTDYEENSGAFRVYWGRVARYKLEWEKQAGVSGVFKEMLAEWGYLSEPQKN